MVKVINKSLEDGCFCFAQLLTAASLIFSAGVLFVVLTAKIPVLDKNASNLIVDAKHIGVKIRTTMTMEDLNIFLGFIERNVSFGFAHFNDGELKAIVNSSFNESTDFGWQKCSQNLSSALLASLINTADNFYVGLPCVCEFDGIPFSGALTYLNISYNHRNKNEKTQELELRSLARCGKKRINLTDFQFSTATNGLNERVTVATVFLNGNFHYAKEAITRIIRNVTASKQRNLHVVTAGGHNWNRLPFPVKNIHFTTKQNAFESSYEKFRNPHFLDDFGSGDIVLLMCGPLGRILASMWTRLRNDVTFLEMGSFWDQELWGRKYVHDKHIPCMYAGDIASSRVERWLNEPVKT